MEIQVFGMRNNAVTRKALRFFAERRIRTHFVDLSQRPASAGELRRFAQKFGVGALLDRGSRRFAELGLGSASYSDERWFDRLVEDPRLLVQPLIRNGSQLSLGDAEAEWKEWTGR